MNTYKNAWNKNIMTTLNASEDAEKQDYSYIAGKNVK